MHVVWYTAMSMDGRVADAADDLGFLDTISSPEGAAEEFEAFLADIDAVVVGGTTQRWLVRHGHGLPAPGLPTWLLSHDVSLRHAIPDAAGLLEQREGDVAAVLEEIAGHGHERVWLCGGGDVAGQLLAADLVDEVVVTIAPTALGAGPALFDAPGLPLRRFRLEECRPHGDDAVRLRWLRDRREPAH
ncbi:MAG: uncharacterized protein JWM98_2577 [Thermoleophilia bacterium]|nr:uncharacterized protein [Thermoleophilia bacterium]